MRIEYNSLHNLDLNLTDPIRKEISADFGSFIKNYIEETLSGKTTKEYTIIDPNRTTVRCVVDIFNDSVEAKRVEHTDTIARKLLNSEQNIQEQVRGMTQIQRGSILQALVEDGGAYRFIIAKVEHSEWYDNDTFIKKYGILSYEQEFPSVLGPNEEHEFEVDHRMPSIRPGLAKELELVFYAEDENYKRYRCIASKSVENPREDFAIGSWIVNVKREGCGYEIKITGCANSVLVAISDAEDAIQKGKYESAVDRLHTALHGYIESLLKNYSINIEKDENLPSMYSKLCKYYEATYGVKKRIGEILRSGSGMIHYINEIRNKNTLAHPNPELIQNEEAILVIKLVDALFEYITGIERKAEGK